MSPAPAGAPAGRQVAVRMYRQGLGDCFLLSFREGAAARHLLIDCGVVLGTENAVATVGEVAASVVAATGGAVDLLVATHEHWDHVSGFVQAPEVFANLRAQEVWLAWTEDPNDRQAEELRVERAAALRALRLAVARLRALGAGEAAGRIDELVSFFGAAGQGGQGTTAEALARVRERGPVRYRRPGEGPLTLPGLDWARIYVLGPPLDLKLLRRANPSKREKEVYEEPGLALDSERAFFSALALDQGWAGLGGDGALRMHRQLPEDERLALERTFPFDVTCRRPLARAAKDAFYRRRYAAPRESWRKIESDWLGPAGDLALQLDNATNNTSLALAIELLPSGRVLLFPADAQVGNWLSWHDLSWQVSSPSGEATVRAEDLLRRTVLYKVGHHASHNATLRARGLELMTDPELVAMIPVDERVAREKKRWNMPFPPLYERLLEKTEHRVLRADQPPPTRAPADSAARVWSEFRRRTRVDRLYLEYTIDAER